MAMILSYWEWLKESSPLIMRLHLAMFLGFCTSVFLSFRRPRRLPGFAWAVAAFACGSIAMRLGIGNIRHLLADTALLNPFFVTEAFQATQPELHFYIGSGLSFLALIVWRFAPARRNS